MSLDYIRRAYGVPAKRGGRVEYTGEPGKVHLGTICGARGNHLRIKLDGIKHSLPFHPTWELRYILAPPSKLRSPTMDKALEAVRDWLIANDSPDFISQEHYEQQARDVIAIYLSALPATDTRGLVERPPAGMTVTERQDAWAALRMVADAVGELFGPAASIESEDGSLKRGPEYHHFAQGIVEALQRLADTIALPVDIDGPLDAVDREMIALGDRLGAAEARKLLAAYDAQARESKADHRRITKALLQAQKWRNRAEKAEARLAEAEGTWMADRATLAEAARDPSLSDAAVRSLCLAQRGEITPEIEAWAESAARSYLEGRK